MIHGLLAYKQRVGDAILVKTLVPAVARSAGPAPLPLCHKGCWRHLKKVNTWHPLSAYIWSSGEDYLWLIYLLWNLLLKQLLTQAQSSIMIMKLLHLNVVTVAIYFLCLKIVCINLCGLLYSQNFNRSKSEKLMFAGVVAPTTSFNTTF